jgi:serine/threonine protein kinase
VSASGEEALRGVPLSGTSVRLGDVLAGKYRLDALVGEGGTGIVVRAMHLPLERAVAIKFLRTSLASEEIRMRLGREARAIESIESEHVVLVLDVGFLADGLPYMVMELLDGRDLARVLREDGPLEVEDAVGCMLQVCEALSAAHALGIVHRDLKPANLFLTRDDDGIPHVKVVDFGISKISDPWLLSPNREPRGLFHDMTATTAVLGSPRYMAPEQLRSSKNVDARADLWSVGAVLFQLVTGKYAFDAESNVAASVKVLTGEADDLRALAPHVPAALDAVVRRCLAKEASARWQSAAELAEALRPFASERVLMSLDRLRAARGSPTVDLAPMGYGPRATPRPPVQPGSSDLPPPATERMMPVMPAPATTLPPVTVRLLPPPAPVRLPPPPAVSPAPLPGPPRVLLPVALAAFAAVLLALAWTTVHRSAAARRQPTLDAGAAHP